MTSFLRLCHGIFVMEVTGCISAQLLCSLSNTQDPATNSNDSKSSADKLRTIEHPQHVLG